MAKPVMLPGAETKVRGAIASPAPGVERKGRVEVAGVRQRVGAAAALVVVVAVAACGGRRQAPTADRPPPAPPSLSGLQVMVVPAQSMHGAVPADLDTEIAFWLKDRSPRTRWVFPPDLARALARTPGLDIDLRNLAVSTFRAARVDRIGDPLYGDLRRLAELVQARWALLPVAAGYVPGTGGAAGRVEIRAALIDTLGGEVLWYGVVAGSNGAQNDPAVTASAAQALAAALVR